MARSVKVHLVDDIDGSVADETVRFTLDGVAFEIDLNSGHADELRRAIARYIVAGRRSTAGIVTGRRPTRGIAPATSDKNQNAAIRAWASSAGIELNSRGRIPQSVIEKYEKAVAG